MIIHTSDHLSEATSRKVIFVTTNLRSWHSFSPAVGQTQSTACSFADGSRWRAAHGRALFAWVKPQGSAWDNERAKAQRKFEDMWNIPAISGNKEVTSFSVQHWSSQHGNAEFCSPNLKRNDKFGKGIERGKGDYSWAGKSPVVKCLFQHRSPQHSRWSLVSLSKPADRWKDTGTGIGNRAGSSFRNSPQFCVLLFKITFKTRNIWNHDKKGCEKQDFFCFCNVYRDPSIYVIWATPNCFLFYLQNTYNSHKIPSICTYL